MEVSDATLIEKIESLKKKRNAVILAHNCQLGVVQDIADFVGDSLEVAMKAAETDADVVVICGMQFIAEMAYILRPDKTILLPDMSANCSMVGMITVERLQEKKKRHPKARVVCYIKSPADVKAESDICCTATNAVSIVGQLPPDEEIIFVPDQYLGDYVCSQTGREMILWPGYCPSAVKVTADEIAQKKEQHPQAKVAVHLECTPQVRAVADAVSSTAGIIKFARETDAKEIIVATETGLLHRLRKDNPDKTFIAASERAVCVKMKLITLETILWSLENMAPQVKVPENIRVKARIAIDRMLEHDKEKV